MKGHLRILIVCLVGLVAFWTTCSRESSHVTLMIGGAPAELDYWEQIVQQFSEASGIPVKIMRQPTDTDQRRQSLLIPLEAGQDDPDVFLMDIVWIGQFAASGWLLDLDDYIEQDNFSLDAFFGSIIEFADRFEGATVALPVYIDAGLLYYRTDLVERYGYKGAPGTWEELAEWSVRIQGEERKANPDFWAFVWQGAQYEGLVCNFLEYALSNGGSLVDSSGRLTLDRPENIEALRFMKYLISSYAISPPNTYTEMKEEESRTLFEGGNALFERNWPYAWSLHQAAGSNVRNRVGIALLPKFRGGRHVAALGGWHIGISEKSDCKAGSWELVKFVVSRPTQLGFAVKLGWNPARRDLYDAPEISRDLAHLVRLKEVFENASARPNVPYYSRLSRVLQSNVSAALSGMVLPEQALRTAQEEALEVVQTYEQ
jgi:multiple sugar transport system substrate-binding protein